MGEEAAALDRETEVVWSRVAPAIQGAGQGQPIEGVVYLDRVEVVEVGLEHAAVRSLLRIEAAPPVLVLPAGGADPNLGCHSFWLGRVPLP